MEKDVFDPELELIQIAYSPYCEVIRWALDEKGLSAKQSYYLPGMQAEGTCQDNDVAFLPRLRIDDHYLHCPESIIQLIELFLPFPSLFPTADLDYFASLELQRRFFWEWGPKLQKMMLVLLLDRPDYTAALWSRGHAESERRLYQSCFAMASRLIERESGLEARNDILHDGVEALREASAWVIDSFSERRYIHDDHFTASDMIAAAFLAPFAHPIQSPLALVDPVPKNLRGWCLSQADSELMAWVRWIHAQHHGALESSIRRSAGIGPS